MVDTEEDEMDEYVAEYWRKNVRLKVTLLTIWAVVSLLLAIVLVEQLNQASLGGVPLGFWVAQQGSIYVFVILIFVYAVRMDRMDADLEAKINGEDTDS